MTKARVIAQYIVTSSNIVDNTITAVKFSSFLQNTIDMGSITDSNISIVYNLETLND